MSTVPSGLAALQQAVSDLTAAVTAATAAIKASGDSDTAVGELAAQVETQVSALNSVIPAPPTA